MKKPRNKRGTVKHNEQVKAEAKLLRRYIKICPHCHEQYMSSSNRFPCRQCGHYRFECPECHAELYHGKLPIALLIRGTGGVGNRRYPKYDEENGDT